MSTRMIAQVITPAYPSMNSTYNVSESTLRVRLRIIRLAVTAAAALSPPQQQQQQPVILRVLSLPSAPSHHQGLPRR